LRQLSAAVGRGMNSGLLCCEPMAGLFDGTSLQRPVTCERCGKALLACICPRGADGKVLLPKDQPARVRREQRRGKVVTVIAGLDPKASDLAGLLKQLKTTLGAGGTVADGEIEVQGDHRDKVVAWLIKKGYPAKSAGG
jgi:translation initiation factor 1